MSAPHDGGRHHRHAVTRAARTRSGRPNSDVDISELRFEPRACVSRYHCHILEHEDHDMMRPFVVMPAELMPFMDMHTSREDMRDRKHA